MVLVVISQLLLLANIVWEKGSHGSWRENASFGAVLVPIKVNGSQCCRAAAKSVADENLESRRQVIIQHLYEHVGIYCSSSIR